MFMKSAVPVIIIIFAYCNQPVKGENGEVYTSAVQYNNYIIERQKRVGVYVSYFYKVLNSNLDSAAIVLEMNLSRINKSLDEIKRMPPYAGDSSFRKAAIRSFSFYKRLFEIDYPVVLSLHRKGATISQNDQQAIQKILDQIIRQEDSYDKELHNSQRDFAEKNQMSLGRD